QNIPAQAIELPQLKMTEYSVESGYVKFDLEVELYESPSGLQGIIEYSTDLFEAATMERFVGHYCTLLKSIVAAPDQAIADLSLLTVAERHQILVEWNDTKLEYPQDECIHHLFEAQVQRTPEAVAVVFEGQQLTYRELNQQANQLAHYLISLGVGPDKLVGLCVDRSPQMVIGLLGILKAGGTYIPLDPAFPRQRLTTILQDSGMTTLVTQHKFVGH
ncbi:MAG: AMP-binding protein, partial [Anaerolineae bacterium]|nr:AMP-binding protein [Anaerolineae bacterium]